jgi:hypothetical protein
MSLTVGGVLTHISSIADATAIGKFVAAAGL